ncbi:hypothetical protein A7K91_14295 [Paenibacillus oryzae]|uniref:Uncharacterized protein n=1 Tax=Paenibacillus oryzae TaxID=1844972 RepID=A0A1A5YJI8_9BACL|nr:hypothetical protein [Paenibacillus oryzae]OBR65728.1 hypothetical protein A7K91_14295 [Paenibacillus oryzae]
MKRVTIFLLLIGVLVLSACAVQEGNKGPEKKSSNENEQLVLVENKELDIKISGVNQPSSGMIEPLIVQIGETNQSFNWENVSNETYYPELIAMDLDNDEEQELIIVLTTGYGTGIKDSEVHVLKKDFTEIPFPNPLDNAHSKLEDSLDQNGEERSYTITVEGQSSQFTFKEEDAIEWFEKAVVGQSLSYRVEDDEIVAVLSVQVSPAMVVGDLEIPYKLVDGQFTEQPARFIASE